VNTPTLYVSWWQFSHRKPARPEVVWAEFITRTKPVVLSNNSFFASLVAFFFIATSSLAEADQSSNKASEQPPAVTESVLSVNDPIYFIAGGQGDTKARLQFSFKYRIFDEDSEFIDKSSWMRGFHFAYTQTSLWNLSASSAPFEDSSYKPSFFWDFYTQKSDYWPAFIRTGYAHESNGRAEEASRGIDTLFFWPFWGGKWHEQDWLIGPKIYAYVSKSDGNEDIEEYRGYTDLYIRYGHEDDWLLSTTLRRAGKNRNMIEMDISLPVRKKIFSRTGGYIYLQVFHGYGESLLSYNEKQDLQLRIGFAIVR